MTYHNDEFDDFDVSEMNTNEGIEASAIGSGPEWNLMARRWLKERLQTHEYVFVDELWEAGLPIPKSPRSMGAVMRHGAKQGWMHQIDIDKAKNWYVAKTSTRGHKTTKRVWKSAILGATDSDYGPDEEWMSL